MSGSKLTAVIAVDTVQGALHIYSKSPKMPARIDRETLRARFVGAELFAELDVLLKSYRERNPNVALDRAALILPDHAVCTDTITIPVVRKSMVNHSLSLAINSLYKNSEELKFSSYPLSHNKVNLTYGVVGMRREYLDRAREVLTANGITVSEISFFSNAAVNGLFTLSPKLKGGTFLFANLQKEHCHFSFVQKGRVIGFYTLPFGYSILSDKAVREEHTLFDHRAAEQLVQSSKQLAKTRQLSVTNATEKLVARADGDTAGAEQLPLAAGGISPRTGRKLPKLYPAQQNRL